MFYQPPKPQQTIVACLLPSPARKCDTVSLRSNADGLLGEMRDYMRSIPDSAIKKSGGTFGREKKRFWSQ